MYALSDTLWLLLGGEARYAFDGWMLSVRASVRCDAMM